MKPLIKLFQLSNDDCYFFDTNRNEIVAVSPDFYTFLDNYINSGNFSTNDVDSSTLFQTYIDNGYLSDNRVQVIQHPLTDFLESILDSKIESINFQVTQSCNLRCIYCPYSGNYYSNRKHSNKKMTFELIKKGLHFLAFHSTDSQRLSISFYGGEPLLELDLIEKSMEYANSLFSGKSVVYAITTNATIMTERVMNLLDNNKVSLLISLDGPAAVHNQNRKYASGEGSFDDVIKNLHLLKQKHPDYYKEHVYINTVMSSDVNMLLIDSFYEEEPFFKGTYIQTTITNPAYVKEEGVLDSNYRTSSRKNYEFKKYIFLLHKLGRVSNCNSRILANYFEQIEKAYDSIKPSEKLPAIFHPSGPCVPGRKKLFMDVEGTLYPCERIDETSPVGVIGNINDGIDIEKCEKLLNVGKDTENQCRDCWAISHCKLCFVHSDNGQELDGKKRLKRCAEIRQTILEEFKDLVLLKKYHYDFTYATTIKDDLR